MIPPPQDVPPPPPPPPDAMVAAAPPERSSGMSRGMRRTIAAVAIIAIVLVGIIGYAVAGFAYASARAAGAGRTLNTVVSHQNSLNSTFKEIDTKFKGLSSGATFDPKQAHTLIDQFVASAKSAGTTVGQDDS
ncbi:MAG: hypothetical protein M3R21_11290, partial [Candidatus Dormibacteraeota bacterium]|nr:hypothetical protein [Candidatus Dormibacteraeota bacterium]